MCAWGVPGGVCLQVIDDYSDKEVISLVHFIDRALDKPDHLAAAFTHQQRRSAQPDSSLRISTDHYSAPRSCLSSPTVLMNSLAADHAAVQLMGRALYRWRVCCQDLRINLDINQHAENCWNLRMADRAVYLMRVQMVAASHLEYAADQSICLQMSQGLRAFRGEVIRTSPVGRNLQRQWKRQQSEMVSADRKYAAQLSQYKHSLGWAESRWQSHDLAAHGNERDFTSQVSR